MEEYNQYVNANGSYIEPFTESHPYDKGSGIAIEVVSSCHRKSEHVKYY